MKKFTSLEQVQILLQCNNATELLESKERITEIQPFSEEAIKLYDVLMLNFFIQNKITA